MGWTYYSKDTSSWIDHRRQRLPSCINITPLFIIFACKYLIRVIGLEILSDLSCNFTSSFFTGFGKYQLLVWEVLVIPCSQNKGKWAAVPCWGESVRVAVPYRNIVLKTKQYCDLVSEYMENTYLLWTLKFIVSPIVWLNFRLGIVRKTHDEIPT